MRRFERLTLGQGLEKKAFVSSRVGGDEDMRYVSFFFFCGCFLAYFCCCFSFGYRVIAMFCFWFILVMYFVLCLALGALLEWLVFVCFVLLVLVLVVVVIGLIVYISLHKQC